MEIWRLDIANMSIFSIDDFIPSKTYREFLKKNKIELTPKQIAKLIYKYGKTFDQRWKGYQNLIDDPRTESDLAENLRIIIDYEKAFVKQELKEKPDSIYVLDEFDQENDYERCEVGVFPSIKVAKKIGKIIGHKFYIKRHTLKEYSDEEIKQYAVNYLDNWIGDTFDQEFSYDEKGNLKTIDYMYIKGEEENIKNSRYSEAIDSLESIFGNYPLCFKNGDIIKNEERHYLKGRYGIIHIRQDREKEILRIASIPGATPDDELLTEFMDEDGEFGHSHLMVTELERVETDEIPEEKREVLFSASALIKGESTIDELQYCIIRMKEKR